MEKNRKEETIQETEKAISGRPFLADKQKLSRLAAILKKDRVTAFEYYPQEDRIVIYDEQMEALEEVNGYLKLLADGNRVHQKDCWKVEELLSGKSKGPVEVRTKEAGGGWARKIVDISLLGGDEAGEEVLVGIAKDITMQKKREEFLEDQAKKDAMTSLYNHYYGRELINEYLRTKNPYDSCGLMVVDIDYFKNVNDHYGHLFGDKVLTTIAHLFLDMFEKKDVVMRAGGDEFVILVKEINHVALVKKAMQLVKSVEKLTFPDSSYSATCSVGVCYLSKNISGFTYDQLFENADWALYRAKQNGRNRYEFCDNLYRFELNRDEQSDPDIDARYLQNDIVATAFEIFEKMNSFNTAIELLLKVIGYRFQLDRITIMGTDIKSRTVGRQYQWTSGRGQEALQTPARYEKEDFLTLFHSYDEYGTAVLQYDELTMFSEEAQALLMQGGAKTVVFAAMYCEGKYKGAIAYVSCENRRYWSKQNRSQLGELTKIISAHLEKKNAMNASARGIISSPEYDSLTGLLSFSRFREEVERIIVGGYATSHVIVYSDFEDFKYFNQKYGYSMGDQLLREFANYVIETMEQEAEAYFTRVVADQFILFMPYDAGRDAVKGVTRINNEFIEWVGQRLPGMRLKIRTGIYFVEAGCVSASAAIDAANFARKQATGKFRPVVLYDEALRQKKILENEIVNGLDEAMQKHQLKVYLQPRFSLNDLSVVGAEALIRWQKPDGTMLYPDSFIPLYEKNGRVVDLDFYVFEQVAGFLAKNNELGRKQVPISINASILHASDEDTIQHYLGILEKYGVDPTLTEIELTETAAVTDYGNVRRLFKRLQNANMKTAMDDFGAGYSVLNTVIDIPVNTVKIDRAFINNCQSSERGVYFLKQMVAVVKGLGYHVVCEGVETQEQVEILRQAGCEEAQGYWFARPMPIEEYEKLVYQEK